jgi:4'-phosphopantetheinyl transferase
MIAGPPPKVNRGGSQAASRSRAYVEDGVGRRGGSGLASRKENPFSQPPRMGRCGSPPFRRVKTGGRDCGDVVGLPVPSGTDESQDDSRVSLWWASLNVSGSTLPRLTACLSSEERKRADSFRRPLDRRRFLAARGWLRHLLASQLGCVPGDVPKVTGDRGKPRLACSDLFFNASWTASIALYATSWRMDVGVDIEAIRTIADVDGIVARFMSPAEQRALASLPPAHRLAAFFQCWTRKEAYVKGIGTGLGFPLPDLDVWDGGRRQATVSGWSIHQVDVAPGFAAAVAGTGPGEWVPQGPRRLVASSLAYSYRPPPGCSPRALVAQGG